MRLCRFNWHGQERAGLYDDRTVIPLPDRFQSHDLLDYLAPRGRHAEAVRSWVASLGGAPAAKGSSRLPHDEVEWLLPIPRPGKILLVSHNYPDLADAGSGGPLDRSRAAPHLFMKPATTLVASRQPIVIPRASPHHVDWEIEMCVVIGQHARHVSESDALSVVAGYTVVNDVSDRGFRPSLARGRTPRPNDAWFDWLHGKWHDTFLPCGPCVASSDAILDPQRLAVRLSVNGVVRQRATTAEQIFPVASVVSFASGLLTLEPGDLIATGTPAGTGHRTATYLAPGDRVEAWIEGIGTLVSPVVAESAQL